MEEYKNYTGLDYYIKAYTKYKKTLIHKIQRQSANKIFEFLDTISQIDWCYDTPEDKWRVTKKYYDKLLEDLNNIERKYIKELAQFSEKNI